MVKKTEQVLAKTPIFHFKHKAIIKKIISSAHLLPFQRLNKNK